MDRLPAADAASDDSTPPAAKRARIEPEGLDWAASFGKKDAAAQSSGASSSSGPGGGWSLRNWSQEKKAEPAPQAAEEEDWSFFQQTESVSTTSTSTTSSSSSSSSSSAPMPVASSFKVPQGRGDAASSKQRRVSFAAEVKVVTIPKVSKTIGLDPEDDRDFDADGNPLYAEASIGDLEGGDLELEEEGEEMQLQQDADAPAPSLRLAHSDEGVEGLIDYLLSSVPAQGKSSKSGAKYFGTSAKGTPASSATPHESSSRTAAAMAAHKRFDTKREDLDEDSFLEAFIDSSDDVAAAAAAPSSGVDTTLPVEGGDVVAKEKKAKKKPTFKF